jgi:hypothetical protein
MADHAAEPITVPFQASGLGATRRVGFEANCAVAYGERGARALWPVSHGAVIDRWPPKLD